MLITLALVTLPIPATFSASSERKFLFLIKFDALKQNLNQIYFN
jgi:hypothetical protein